MKENKTEKNNDLMQEVIAFLKSRGFVFPSSEIYGGFNGVYDYGHYGYLLIQNIKSAWMKSMIQEREDVVSLDSGIFMHPLAWKASGHVDTFNDPQIDCKKCGARFRADIVLEKFGVNADKQTLEFINTELDKLRAEKKLVCENCGSADLTQAKVFSLMVKSNLGSPTDTLSEDNVVYLRPETCGGIYLEYKNTLDALHPKIPFGIAQIGKAFRNEIVTKQFVFRTREFEQMEMQYFFNPKADEGKSTEIIFKHWQEYIWAFYLEYGIKKENIKWYKHEKLAHYASDAYDVEYKYNMLGGEFKELEGIHARGDWDLSQHSKFSGKDLSYFDEATRERFIPHIVETSVGVARMMLAFVDNAYTKEEVKDGEERIVLKLDNRLSPVKVAILPLMKKEELSIPAKNIWKDLSKKYFCEFDMSGSIGKRYRRQDEIGTPYCLTFDYDSIVNESVTVRDRDTMTQERVKITDLKKYLEEKLGF